MKIKIFIAITLLYSTIFHQFVKGNVQQEDLFKSGTVTIIGQIKDYDSKNSTARLTYHDAITAKQYQEVIFIESNGNFKLTVELLHSLNTSFFQYGRVLFQMYLIPGETYCVTINPDGSHVFTGTNGATNNQLFDLSVTLRARFKKETDRINSYFYDSTSDYSLFEKLCTELELKKVAFVDNYFKKGKINSKAEELLKKEIKYENSCNLMIYRRIWSTNKSEKRIDLPTNYFDQVYSRFPINDPSAIEAARYIAFITNILNSIWDDFHFKEGIIDYFKRTQKFNDRQLFLISKYLIKDTTTTKTTEFSQFFSNHDTEIKTIRNRYLLTILLNSVKEFQPGIGRDLLISQGVFSVFFKDPIFSPSLEEWNQIGALISNKSILIHLKNIDQYNHAITGMPINTKTNIIQPLQKNEQEKVYEKLIGKYVGKVVYIDFWATWCGPCRQEIPYSKILSDRFSNQDVVFLYLCCQSDKKSWETMLKSERMTGDQYLLSNDEYNILAKMFDIKGLPTYALVDKKGNLVSKNASRPSAGPLIISAIEKLLK